MLQTRRASVTLDGERVELLVNIELPEEAEHALAAGATGVGLFRSEFLFMNRDELPSEDEQYEAYREVAKAMGTRPVVIRTLDVGGDKIAASSADLPEDNPAMGWRAIRIGLDRPYASPGAPR